MNKKGEIMKQKRISFGQGKGSLTHNNREFVADKMLINKADLLAYFNGQTTNK